MAAEETGKCSEAYPMKGGDGPSNYAKNSIYQKGRENEELNESDLFHTHPRHGNPKK
ncbi:hypothetical protein ABKV19_020272 [Rosa sericea]